MSAEGVVCVEDFEKFALKSLGRSVADYYSSGADREHTLRENRDAFSRLRLRPRCLRDVSSRRLSTEVLGRRICFPVGIAPSAMQRMAHPDGELATVRAAASEGTVMILSTLSTASLEEVSEAAPSAQRWFQLYIYRDRGVTRELVSRAEAAGFGALVLTVDTPLFGNRLSDARNKFELPPHLRLANFDDAGASTLPARSPADESGLKRYANALFDPSLCWADVKWLRSVTRLPLVVKGILTAEDARMAVDHGVSGILVSNHGARQLDGVPATIEALPEVVRAVSGRCEVYLDGGIRNGTDVLKALALGARAVFVGRPALWGLAHSGENGVRQVLQILKNELDLALALVGCASVEDIEPTTVVGQEFYSRM